jgi:serine/threonine protein kinase
MSLLNLRLFREGTWADLYLAELSTTGDTVMVKMLRQTKDPSAKRLFLRELRILTKAIHHRVLRAILGRPDAERPYYVMPYFKHGPLTEHAGKLNHAQLRAAAQQLCEAIAAMHSQEIIHGDVKPDNLMVANDGNLQLGDPLGNGSGCTVMITANSGGTPGYWAPELAGGSGPMSKAGDVFSIGATLYHLATGRRPTDGQNLDPWVTGVAVPKDIRLIIGAACRTAPETRPSAAQLLRALQGDLSALAPAVAGNTGGFGSALAAVGGILLGALLLRAAFK